MAIVPSKYNIEGTLGSRVPFFEMASIDAPEPDIRPILEDGQEAISFIDQVYFIYVLILIHGILVYKGFQESYRCEAH